jgi:Omp85 superfamily domain
MHPRLAWLVFLSVMVSAAGARAEATDEAPPPRRYEFLPVPNLGGNSDIGVEIGVAFTLARFYDDERPYRWLFAGVLATSFKDDANGFRAVQQYHLLRLDLPNLFSGRLRLDNQMNVVRAIDARYYGVGNASAPGGLPPGPLPARQDEYVSQEVRARTVVRIKTGTPLDAAFAASLRGEAPDTYAGSKLAADATSAGIAGTQAALLSSVAAGVIVDTRDNEFVPSKGSYYQLGGGGTIGSAERVAYGELALVMATYFPLARGVTLATRLMTSFQLGRVPFYDLQQGGVFYQQYMLGGDDGLRGVRQGRYAGHVKLLANYELRTALIPRFRVFHWRLQVGTTTFFDAGRVFSDYDTPSLDGRGLGVKYSTGGGFFFQWDQSSVFRVEAAYSPDNRDTGGFPVFFYLANGLIF